MGDKTTKKLPAKSPSPKAKPLPYAILVCTKCRSVVAVGNVEKASHRVNGETHEAKAIKVEPVPMEPLEKMDDYLKRLGEIHKEKIA